jgi:hypothetical protein
LSSPDSTTSCSTSPTARPKAANTSGGNCLSSTPRATRSAMADGVLALYSESER